MKKLLPVACALALVASLGFTQDPPVPDDPQPDAPVVDLAERIDALEKELAATKKELAETKARVEATVTYLHTQAAGAKSMVETLAAAEEAGFIPGPNFTSREILLGGMNKWWGAKETNLPAKKPAKPAEPAPGPPQRRAGGR